MSGNYRTSNNWQKVYLGAAILGASILGTLNIGGCIDGYKGKENTYEPFSNPGYELGKEIRSELKGKNDLEKAVDDAKIKFPAEE